METLSYNKEVRAKKEHRCNFCGSKIVTGQIYSKSTHVNDGEIYDWKTHKWCGQLADDLKLYDYCGADGVTQDDFVEAVHSEHDTIMHNLLPDNTDGKYGDIIQQIQYVHFDKKMWYLIRHFNKQKELQK